MAKRKARTPGPNARQFAVKAARLLAGSHCEEVVVLDVKVFSQVTDFVVIGTGTSGRQMRSVSDDVSELGEQNGHGFFRVDRDRNGEWTIVDFMDVTVHLFEPNLRAYYDLENLWPDARRVEWRPRGRAASKAKAGAGRPGGKRRAG